MVVLVLQPKGYAASLIYTPSDRTSANDVHDVAQDVPRGIHEDLVALLTGGFVGYAKMSDEQLEEIWRAEGLGEF